MNIPSGMTPLSGIKWFIFYTRVRPWFCVVAAFFVFFDYAQNTDVYFRYPILFLTYAAAMAQAILGLITFAKSFQAYDRFVEFVNGVLIFEMAYYPINSAISIYFQTESNQLLVAILCGIIAAAIFFFSWYRPSIRYFKRRIAKKTTEKPQPILSPASAPPSLTSEQLDVLRKLKELADAEVLTQEEFEAKKKQILGL